MPRPTPPGIERDVGMECYLTPEDGIGGRLKTLPEDFVVEEVPLAFPPPVAEGKYTVAALRVRNWETNRLMAELAQRLRVPRETIFFAGTKDKRAVTTQYVSLRAPEDAVRALSIRDVEVLETRRVDRAPKIGELVGNRFVVRVRGHEGDPRPILARIEAEGGFPNYFGVQRFGVLRPVTHLVGEAILRGELEEAVRLYAGNPSPYEPEDSRAARAAYEKEGARALDLYPRHLSFERTLVAHLVERPGDFEGALLRLPRNLLTMFVYAAQSRAFNRVVARRMEMGLGLNEPVEGDVVFGLDAEGVPDKDRPHKVNALNLERVRRLCRQRRALVTGVLFGSDVPLAEGRMGELEAAVIEEMGWTREHFLVPHLPEAASFGTRRELLAPLGPVKLLDASDAHGPYSELSFFLLKGSYATCLLREVMKSEAAAFA
ncbi:MAG TPA: tRNA pseudouridine(13) synthase TruD [Candidatus Thermoplasmatota archaeon]|nr:tRNA pseudouridine(13) synthase TruD [Candidatus Thermoplasmatota archaeon]